MPYYLAIDQSTSATKALLFSASGEFIDKESIEHAQIYPQPGWVEHDAEEIWGNLLTVCARLLARRPEVREQLRCLSLTNQRETLVVFEKGSGKPLGKAMVWQCRRGAALCREAEEQGYGRLVEERTGLKIDAYFTGSKLKWLMRNMPEVAELIRNGQALVGTVDAYLIYRLTSGSVFATDTTNASRTLLYDIGAMRWDEELCELWEVPVAALPEARDSGARFGETILGGILDTPLPICGVMGDSQAALFAQGCFEPGSAKVTFGTGSSILMQLGEEYRRSKSGVLTTLAWSIDGVPRYAFEGIVISSASTLAWLRDQLGLFQSYDQVEPMARSLTSNGGVYLVPAFTGLGLPYWQPEARAAIVGLSPICDRRHIVRAGLESIGFQVCEALAAMREEAGLELRRLQADGGATNNGFLMQFVADLCGVELAVSSMADCSALGAAMAGMLGMGDAASLEALPRVGAEAISYAPELKRIEATGLLGAWRSAVAQTVCGL